MNKILRQFGALTLAALLAVLLCTGSGLAENLGENRPDENTVVSNVVGVSAMRAEELNPDQTFIKVEKKFEGITVEQIPENFYVQVGDEHLDKAGATLSADGLTWTWQISGQAGQKYSVTEGNAKVENYELEVKGIGDAVEVTPGKIDVPAVMKVTPSAPIPYGIEGDMNRVIIIALTGNSGNSSNEEKGGTVVISSIPLSLSAREAIYKAYCTGNFHDPFTYYSLDESVDGVFTIKGRTITCTSSSVTLGNSSDWSWAQIAEYSITAASAPDIAITNTYTPLTRDVTITKQVTGNMGDMGREFAFTVTSDKAMGSDAEDGYILSGDAMAAQFGLKHGESITLKDVPIGATLTIEEEVSGYEMSIAVNNTPLKGNSYIVSGEESAPIVVVVTNHKDAIPDTGILLDSLPYVLILAAVIAIGAFAAIRRRRHRDGE